MKYQKIKIFDKKAIQKSLFKIEEEIESLDSTKNIEKLKKSETVKIFRKEKYEN